MRRVHSVLRSIWTPRTLQHTTRACPPEKVLGTPAHKGTEGCPFSASQWNSELPLREGRSYEEWSLKNKNKHMTRDLSLSTTFVKLSLKSPFTHFKALELFWHSNCLADVSIALQVKESVKINILLAKYYLLCWMRAVVDVTTYLLIQFSKHTVHHINS